MCDQYHMTYLRDTNAGLEVSLSLLPLLSKQIVYDQKKDVHYFQT